MRGWGRDAMREWCRVQEVTVGHLTTAVFGISNQNTLWWKARESCTSETYTII